MDRNELAAALLRALDRMARAFPAAHATIWPATGPTVTLGRDVTLLRPGGPVEGRAVAVRDDFSLEVAYPDGSTEAALRRGLRAGHRRLPVTGHLSCRLPRAIILSSFRFSGADAPGPREGADLHDRFSAPHSNLTDAPTGRRTSRPPLWPRPVRSAARSS